MDWFLIVKNAKGSRSFSLWEKNSPTFYEEQVTGFFSYYL